MLVTTITPFEKYIFKLYTDNDFREIKTKIESIDDR